MSLTAVVQGNSMAGEFDVDLWMRCSNQNSKSFFKPDDAKEHHRKYVVLCRERK
jgi:hypothetical protein